MRDLLRTPQGLAGTVFLLLVLLVAAAGPALAPCDPEAFDRAARFTGPGSAHWLGADQFGRDTLSRLLLGARTTLALALSATLLGTAIGALLGTVSAYLGGWARCRPTWAAGQMRC